LTCVHDHTLTGGNRGKKTPSWISALKIGSVGWLCKNVISYTTTCGSACVVCGLGEQGERERERERESLKAPVRCKERTNDNPPHKQSTRVVCKKKKNTSSLGCELKTNTRFILSRKPTKKYYYLVRRGRPNMQGKLVAAIDLIYYRLRPFGGSQEPWHRHRQRNRDHDPRERTTVPCCVDRRGTRW
jgi:hypothetical protein